jgi:hypothetical protein
MVRSKGEISDYLENIFSSAVVDIICCANIIKDIET